MKLPVVFILIFFSSVNSLTYEILSPRYMKDLIVNKTEEFGMQIKTQTANVGNIITSYADAVQKQTHNAQSNVKKYFNKAYNGLTNTIGDIQTETARKLEVNVLNTEVLKYNPEMYLDTVQLIAMNGYPAESHTIKTEDGYLLTIHRIPHAKNSTVIGHQAVLLQHGILGSSSNYVTSGSEKGLAYILSEAGYDVWMGNFRGNTYSRSHVTLSVSDAAFWNFTWHECAMYDLPAVIDYINNIKQNNDLLYIGHSMGTTTLFALLSSRVEYNNKLKAAFAMAPIAFMTAVRSPIKYLAPFANNIEWIAKSLGADQFIPESFIFKWFAKSCESNHYSQAACQNILFLLSGFNPKEFNTERFPVILSHTPAGTSTRTVVHFAQEIRDNGKFQRFDYGTAENKKIYGQDTPPEYPVEKITLPIALLCASNDLLSSLQDTEALYKKLVNPVEYYKVPMETFNHIDFLWGVDAPTLVYDKLRDMMKEFTVKKETIFSYYLNWQLTL